ncbi:MAG: sulfatase-like hydrolase/transferase [Acidobacteriaceae bacterium]
MPAIPLAESTRPTDNASIMKNCLPWRFRSAGINTVYAHGFSAEMFSRADWVRKLGFEKELFHPELHALGLTDCGGPFRGICDEDVAELIGNELVAERQHHHLIAWTTLNSHLPVEADAKASEKLKCGTGGAAVEDDASCNLIALLMRANHAVAKLALRPDLPATEFVIVGDHAPPFIFKERRERFSQERVLFIHLTPLL